jgi:acylglycerol lipase
VTGNAYGLLFPTLASHGIEVYGFDQRGWGRSVEKASEKGLSGPTSLILSDIASFIKTLLPSKVPYVNPWRQAHMQQRIDLILL